MGTMNNANEIKTMSKMNEATLSAAIAATRKALQTSLSANNEQTLCWRELEWATKDLLAALDAAQGERGLSSWIIHNLLNESQLDVVPPGCDRALRYLD